MAVFGFTETTAIAAWVTFIFYQMTASVSSRQQKRYKRDAPSWGPPSWLFPIVWTLLYSLLTVVIFYFTQVSTLGVWQYYTGVAFFIIHIVLNKWWSVFFWDYKSPTGAMYVLLFGMLPSLVVFLICTLVDQTSSSGPALYLIPVIGTIVYMLWLVYALVLNAYFVMLIK